MASSGTNHMIAFRGELLAAGRVVVRGVAAGGALIRGIATGGAAVRGEQTSGGFEWHFGVLTADV